jgi:hypothetical protein
LLYLLGLIGEILVLTSIYLVMPVGRLSLSHALVGGVTAALLWEVARHVLVWYFSTLSKVNVVYGSMSTAIVVMFSLEIGAGLLLFGAQVIGVRARSCRVPPAGAAWAGGHGRQQDRRAARHCAVVAVVPPQGAQSCRADRRPPGRPLCHLFRRCGRDERIDWFPD